MTPVKMSSMHQFRVSVVAVLPGFQKKATFTPVRNFTKITKRFIGLYNPIFLFYGHFCAHFTPISGTTPVEGQNVFRVGFRVNYGTFPNSFKA